MTLDEFNTLSNEGAEKALVQCCGSKRWVDQMLARRPFASLEKMAEQAEQIWSALGPADWKEAFSHHPEIGEKTGKKWESQEQAGTHQASQAVLKAIFEGNHAYKKKFGYLYIVCATGKSAEEMLGILNARTKNGEEDEIHVAMGEQAKITKIRLGKLFDGK